MKIQNLPPSVASLNPMLKVAKPNKKPSVKAKRTYSLQISSHVQKLENIPAVDVQEIEKIKLAIKNGEFQVNTDAIAEALIESARELLNQR